MNLSPTFLFILLLVAVFGCLSVVDLRKDKSSLPAIGSESTSAKVDKSLRQAWTSAEGWPKLRAWVAVCLAICIGFIAYSTQVNDRRLKDDVEQLEAEVSKLTWQLSLTDRTVAKQQKCLDLIDQRLYGLSEDLRKAQHGGSEFYIRPYENFQYLSMGCSWLED
jgi:hypothetical protein